MVRTFVVLAALSQPAAAFALEPPSTEVSEHGEVVKEACGGNPSIGCLAELRKVCHARLTFRCYYSRKARLDALRQLGFPEHRPRDFED